MRGRCVDCLVFGRAVRNQRIRACFSGNCDKLREPLVSLRATVSGDKYLDASRHTVRAIVVSKCCLAVVRSRCEVRVW